MDLSTYYTEFQSTYNWAVFAVFLALFVVVFIGVRTLKDKKEAAREKTVNLGLLLLLFSSVLVYFFTGPSLAKKDIEEQTIYYYEGAFEIVETLHGIHDKAVFSFDGQKKTLKYSKDVTAGDCIKPGKYEGEIVYAQHLSELLGIEIKQTQGDRSLVCP